MTDPTRSLLVKFFCLLNIFIFGAINLADLEVLDEYSLSNVTTVVKNGCVLVALQPTNKNSDLISILHKLSQAFNNETRVNIGVLKLEDASLISWEHSRSEDLDDYGDLAFFPRKNLDRTCLLRPSWEQPPKAQMYRGSRTVQELLAFLNDNCETFRQLDGSLSSAGLTRKSILENLYRVPNGEDLRHDSSPSSVNIGSTCERIPLPSKEKFFHEYFFRSKPVVITGKKSVPSLLV